MKDARNLITFSGVNLDKTTVAIGQLAYNQFSAKIRVRGSQYQDLHTPGPSNRKMAVLIVQINL